MQVYNLFKFWDLDLRPETLNGLKAMSPEQLHWRPQGWHSSAFDLADHMCQVEWLWIYRNVLKLDPWEARWQKGRFESLESLLAYWDQVHKTTVQWLKEIPVTDLERTYPMPYEHCPEVTVHWVTYHVVEHEAHHRGQLFMLMRMQGLTPPSI